MDEAGAAMLRGGAYKPRTSPYSFQGLGLEGLKLLQEAKEQTGLPIVTELMDVRDVEDVAEVADVIQVGARNMQNYNLLTEIGRTDCAVLLKRGLAATLEELLMAAEYVLKEGNERVMLCERGIRTYETAYRFTLDLLAIPALREMTHLPVIIDPSHAAGRRDWVRPMSLAAAAAGADGIIVEVHNEPEEAICDGPQALPTEGFADYAEQLRAVAGVAGKEMAARRLRPTAARPHSDEAGRARRRAGRRVDRARRASERLGAEVAGFDPDAGDARSGPRARRRRSSRPARSPRPSAAPRSSSAPAPVSALPELVAAALDRQRRRGPGSATSARPSSGWPRRSPGSTQAPRFIGGHPLAGAETAGVENSRADLFEGARWFLTPTERSEGVLFDRLHSFVAEIGARPQAIDPAEHDRAMATISHLPHVLANVLASRAAETLAGSERRPEVGRSFRDTTRVAGANPAIWGDIFAANCEARRRRGRGGDRQAPRGRRAAARGRSGAARRLAAARPRATVTRCSTPAMPAASCSSCGSAVENRPGRRRRDRPGARPRRGQHRGHEPRPVLRADAPARSRCGSRAPTRRSEPAESSASSATP